MKRVVPRKNRTVLLGKLCQSVMQSPKGKTKPWTVEWQNDNPRWTNPLMGWTSSSDPLSCVKLKFDTREQAIRYVERNGWKYIEREPLDHAAWKNFGTNKYSHNFLSAATETELKRNGVKTKEFVNPTKHASHYTRPLKYHGDGEVPQHGKNPDKPYD